MHDHSTEQELKERLSIIERMIAEGRRKTESWGWMFVLWGAAYYIALAWSAWDHSVWAWPVTILIAVIVTVIVASRQARNRPPTNLGRAIGSVWMALGISMFLLFLSLGLSGRLMDQHIFMAAICGLLGMANGACALILRWKVQLACAIVWWLAAVGTCFGSDRESLIVFLVAIFLGQIVFGIYGMIAEGHKRKRRVMADA